jgi:ferredoxin-like protein FixX
LSQSLFDRLDQYGLNLQAVLKIADLPESIRASLASILAEDELAEDERLTDLLLVGHAGRDFWQAFKASPWGEISKTNNRIYPHPVDSFTIATIDNSLTDTCPGVSYRWLYPSDLCVVDLQALGRQVGWHGQSPFRSGVNLPWGPWYAYRAVLLCSPLQAQPEDRVITGQPTPCSTCSPKPCVEACPAGALGESHADFQLQACLDFRLQPDSPCGYQCLARSACPVGKEHRYSPDQMHYHYGVSLDMIRKWQK